MVLRQYPNCTTQQWPNSCAVTGVDDGFDLSSGACSTRALPRPRVHDADFAALERRIMDCVLPARRCGVGGWSRW
jgi:hypothetical protein